MCFVKFKHQDPYMYKMYDIDILHTCIQNYKLQPCVTSAIVRDLVCVLMKSAVHSCRITILSSCLCLGIKLLQHPCPILLPCNAQVVKSLKLLLITRVLLAFLMIIIANWKNVNSSRSIYDTLLSHLATIGLNFLLIQIADILTTSIHYNAFHVPVGRSKVQFHVINFNT